MSALPLRFAIVAGEASGDILGADLIVALKRRFPDACFEGMGGPRMNKEGFHSIYPLDEIAVMGYIEPLKRLRRILSIRKHLKDYFIKNKPVVFIGIDAPDFNLSLEQSLKAQGIKTVHYVSPQIWAWRKGKIVKIKKAVDLMLSLFPFENKIYQEHQIPIVCVGHPLADKIPLESDKQAARQQLQLSPDAKIVALLPGSRVQELKYCAKEFILTAQWLKTRMPNVVFTAACLPSRLEQFKQILSKVDNAPPIQIFLNESTKVMTAADCVLLVSGTASLEAMLIKRPTVVAYKMSPITFQIAKRLIQVPTIALPNLLAGKKIMPEFIQADAVAEKMGKQLLAYLEHPELEIDLASTFSEIHQSLRKNAGETAAKAIVSLIEGK